MKNLIVTSDDFGAAREVNEAVERAHREGILTTASLMVSGPASADAVALARSLPSLRVGLHLVLVKGRAALPARAAPDLVDERGWFHTDMVWSGARMFLMPHVRRQLGEEIGAQFEAFRATGLALDHVNAHKHFHLHPGIASIILALAPFYGVRAARVPLEPRGVLARVERVPLSPLAALTVPFAKSLRRRFRAAGLLVPDHVFGLRWSGAMTAGRVRGIVEHLPDGLSEIYLHPATGPYPGSAPGYAYAEEFATLTDPALKALLRARDIRLGGFSDFPVQSPHVGLP